jgi:hypothetical protein
MLHGKRFVGCTEGDSLPAKVRSYFREHWSAADITIVHTAIDRDAKKWQSSNREALRLVLVQGHRQSCGSYARWERTYIRVHANAEREFTDWL